MDPFEILGISHDASKEEIKAAYRSLVKIHHPDSTHSPDAAKFRQIQDAYERAMKGDDGAGVADWEEIFDEQPGWSRFTFRVMEQRVINLTLEESYFGVSKILMIDNRSFRLDFPPGTMKGMTIKCSIAQMDVVAIANIVPHARYRFISSLDLEVTERVSFIDLMFGGKAEVDTLTGPVSITIRPGLQPGSVLRVLGKGMKSGMSTGDLYVRVEGKLPDKVTPSDAAKMAAAAI